MAARLTAYLLATYALTPLGIAGELRGFVRDAVTSAPIAGARVAARSVNSHNSATVMANETGEFRIANLEPGQYQLRSYHAGYLTYEPFHPIDRPVEVFAGKATPPIEIRLKPAASLEGRLVDEAGRPIRSAKVESWGDRESSSTTDLDGRFRLDHLNGGEKRLLATIPGDVRRETARIVNGQTSGFPAAVFMGNVFDSSAAHPLVLTPGGTLTGVEFRVQRIPLVAFSGVVIDNETQQPLLNGQFELKARNGSYETVFARSPLVNGKFHVDLVRPGTYSARVFRTAKWDEPGLVFEIPLGATGLTGHRIVLPDLAGLSGTAIGPLPNRPQVCFDRRSNVYYSVCAPIGPDAKFHIPAIEPGEYFAGIGAQLTVPPRRIDVLSLRQNGSPLTRNMLQISPSGNAPVEIVFAERYDVYGEVVTPEGKPVAGGFVQVGNLGRFLVPIREGGKFYLSQFAGTYTLSAFTRGPLAGGESKPCPTAKDVTVTGNMTGLVLTLCPE